MYVKMGWSTIIWVHALHYFHPQSSTQPLSPSPSFSLSSPLPPPLLSLSPSLFLRYLADVSGSLSSWRWSWWEDEGMSLISLNEKSVPQMFCRSHLVHRWDSSNQSSQLPVKSHHFLSSQSDLSLIHLKVCRNDFILTRQDSTVTWNFCFCLNWEE